MLDGEINEKELVLWGRAFRTAGEIDRFCRTHTRNEDDYYETITEMILQCLGGEAEQRTWRELSDYYAMIQSEIESLEDFVRNFLRWVFKEQPYPTGEQLVIRANKLLSKKRTNRNDR